MEPRLGEIAAEQDVASTDLSAAEARHLTDQIKTGLSVVWEHIIRAYQGRVWLALGHGSWDAYIRAEFGSMNLQPPREEREQAVASLREAGLSSRAIATSTGLSKGSVGRALDAAGTGAPNGAPVGSRNDPAGQLPDPQTIQGIDGKHYASTRPERPQAETSTVQTDEAPIQGQVSIADELGEDAVDATSGAVLEMSATEAGIELLDLEANERGHREQARRDLREFHESGAAALPMTIKLASRVGRLLSPVVGEPPLTTEEQAGVVTDSARAVRVLANLLGRTAARPEALGDDPAGAEQVISDLTDAVEDLNRTLDGWRTKR